MKKLTLLFVLGLLIQIVVAQSTEKRLALVIGNATYQHGGGLKNPVNDANLMAKTLQDMGFDVKTITNGTLRQMQLATADFTNKIKDYNVALFYYAGHGIQFDGKNYLIPIDAKLENPTAAKFEALDINFINDAFLQNQNNINVMILDACRNNPFRSWERGGERGFKKIDQTAKGSIICYATQPGATAADGIGQNGLYTTMLVQQMKIPQSIEDVFKNTRIAVNQASKEGQLPQKWSSLMGNFYFVKPSDNDTATPSNNNGALIIGNVEAEYGEIIIDTDLGGQLYVDGKFMGNLPANSKNNKLTQQTTGTHSIKIVSNNETLNDIVTVYKNTTANVSFKRNIVMDSPNILYDQRDGKNYKKVKIGTQVWMAENLAYKPTNGNYWAKGSSYIQEYGYLYDWETAQEVCPDGWHLPSEKELNILWENREKVLILS